MAKEEKKRKGKSGKGATRSRRNQERKSRKAAAKKKRKNGTTADKRKAKSKRTKSSKKREDVNLVPTIEFVHSHITAALCAEIFASVRENERDRKWTLFALSRFWTAVVLSAPPSLTQLLEQTIRSDPSGLLPYVDATPEAFFQKCKGFSSGFFMALYHHFVEEVLPKAPTNYASDVAHLQGEFSEVALIDGSRLDKIAHRLKILWDEEAAVLPGCLIAVYDLFRGIATQLWFDSDAAASEFKRATTAAACLSPNSLLVGDRLYCSIQLFQLLQENHSFGVFRRNRSVGIKMIRRLSRCKSNGGTLEDWLVEAGAEKVKLRMIVFQKGGKKHEALTNVLDPKRLSAEDVATLYPLRWQVERLFFDLKEVLNLKKFYCSNPNAVAMQVYAAATVHVAFRIAQSDVAKKASVQPEDVSPKKLFPRLALISIKVIEAEHVFEETRKANPGVDLRKPRWDSLPYATVSLKSILVQRRSDDRRKRTYSENRRKWKSFTKVEGGDKLS